jgi:hypothetical protein
MTGRRSFNASRLDRLRAERKNLLRKAFAAGAPDADEAWEAVREHGRQFPEVAPPKVSRDGRNGHDCEWQAVYAEGRGEWEVAALWWIEARRAWMGTERRKFCEEQATRCWREATA